MGYETTDSRGATTAEKLKGTKIWVDKSPTNVQFYIRAELCLARWLTSTFHTPKCKSITRFAFFVNRWGSKKNLCSECLTLNFVVWEPVTVVKRKSRLSLTRVGWHSVSRCLGAAYGPEDGLMITPQPEVEIGLGRKWPVYRILFPRHVSTVNWDVHQSWQFGRKWRRRLTGSADGWRTQYKCFSSKAIQDNELPDYPFSWTLPVFQMPRSLIGWSSSEVTEGKSRVKSHFACIIRGKMGETPSWIFSRWSN